MGPVDGFSGYVSNIWIGEGGNWLLLAAGVGGILMPNVIIVAAILLELRRGNGVQPVSSWGLTLSIVTEGGVILVTPTAAGQVLSVALAGLGATPGALYYHRPQGVLTRDCYRIGLPAGPAIQSPPARAPC